MAVSPRNVQPCSCSRGNPKLIHPGIKLLEQSPHRPPSLCHSALPPAGQTLSRNPRRSSASH